MDGAFGLWAGGAASTRHLFEGAQLADSWSCDAHKTLNTPYDCGLILCRNRSALVASMQASGSYIQWSKEARDNMQYSPDMSRRARSIELWAALKSLGREGVDQLVSQLCQRAKQFERGLRELGYEIDNQVEFNQVLTRLDSDQATSAALGYIQDSGRIWCGGAQHQGRQVIRISVCSYRTTAQDVEVALEVFAQAKG